MTLQSFINQYLPALEAEMQAVVTAPSPELHDLYAFLRYHLGWTDENFRPIDGRAGKRLRPVFCLLTCEACDGDWQQALPAAAAVELLHNFSLVHDDIEDGDTIRRGRPALWTLCGLAQAINAGDSLHALAHLALLRLGDRGTPAQTVATALRLLESTCLQLTEGQFLDIRFETEESVSVAAYLGMVEKKTAALLATACELGALLAGAPSARRQRLRAFGRHVGLAFQIEDDILGIWGDPKVTGKPVASDLLRRKKTLPVLHALQQSASLRALLAQAELSSSDVERAMERMQETESRSYAEEQARDHTERALAALDASGISGPAAKALQELTLGLLGRKR